MLLLRLLLPHLLLMRMLLWLLLLLLLLLMLAIQLKLRRTILPLPLCPPCPALRYLLLVTRPSVPQVNHAARAASMRIMLLTHGVT